MTCEKKRKLALAIIEDFCACVKPLEQELERGIIHGDFNEQVLLKQGMKYKCLANT